MIDINLYLKNHQNNLKKIISEFDINKEFSSHHFIEKFSQKHENIYIDMLVKHQKSERTFQTVNSIIALYLSNNMKLLNIEKTHRKKSKNVHGNITDVQWWIRNTQS